MAVDYELSTMQSRKQFFAEDENTDGQITLPGEKEFTVRVNKVTLAGIFLCFFLILLGLSLNIYFVLNLNVNKGCMEMRQDTDRIQGSSLLISSDSVRYRPNSTSNGEATLKSDVEYCLDVLRNHLVKTSVQANGQDIDTFLHKVDNVAEKIDDLNGNFDVFDKKLDTIITDIDEKVEHAQDVRASCDEKNETQKSISTLSDQITSLSVTLGTIKSDHEEATRKVEQIQADVDSLSKLTVGTLAESLLEINSSIRSNGYAIANSSKTLLDASKKQISNEQIKSRQLIELVKNNTDKLDSLLRDIYVVSEKLSTVDNEVNKTNYALNAMNGVLDGDVRNTMNKTLTAVLNNGYLIQINANTTNAFFIRTEETMQRIGGIVQELDTRTLLELTHNISDRLNVSQLDIKHIELYTKDIKDNSNEVSMLQRSVLEKTDSMNKSIGLIQEQSLMTGDLMRSLIQNSDDFNRGILHLANDTRSNVTQELRLVEQEMVETISTTADQIVTSLKSIQTEIRNGSNSMSKQCDGIQVSSSELLNLVNASFTAIQEVKVLTRGNSCSMASNASAQLPPNLVNEIVAIKTSVENIVSSITIDSNKLENSNLSTAVIKLLDESSTIHEALMSSANQTLSCRSDGCFFKTIPAGLPPSSDFVQKDEVRLANAQISSGSIRGRLEVYRSGSWGTVCDDSFGNTDATVACRMLGYSTGTQKQSAFFGAGTGTIHMDDVRCSGRESSIFSCTFTSRHNCGHGEDVGVICS